MKLRYCQQKKFYFIYEIVYKNLIVTTKQKSIAQTHNQKKKKRRRRRRKKDRKLVKEDIIGTIRLWEHTEIKEKENIENSNPKDKMALLSPHVWNYHIKCKWIVFTNQKTARWMEKQYQDICCLLETYFSSRENIGPKWNNGMM